MGVLTGQNGQKLTQTRKKASFWHSFSFATATQQLFVKATTF